MFSPTLPIALNITEMLHFFCSESLSSAQSLMEKSVISRCGAQCDNSSVEDWDLSCRGVEHWVSKPHLC